jgi:hypothetical protein
MQMRSLRGIDMKEKAEEAPIQRFHYTLKMTLRLFSHCSHPLNMVRLSK